jgi:predicted permease
VNWRFPIFIRNIFRKERIDRELDDEIHSYLEDLAAENVRRGMSREEALREARKDLGGFEQVKEGVRDIRTGVAMDTLLQDVRYGLRTLLKHRSFSFVTIFTLALGIGVCTAIFSLVNAVLIRSLPYGEPERLVYLYTPNVNLAAPAEAFEPSTADFFDLKRQSQSFANATLFEQADCNVAVGDRTERMGAAKVDEYFFNTLQSTAAFGRVFNATDQQPGNNHVVVISDALWHGTFGGRADVLGRTLRIEGKLSQVVGVMPKDFGFPHKSDLAFGSPHIETTQLWIPSALTPQEKVDREGFNGVTLVRLKPGVTLPEAQAEMSTLMSRLDLLHDASARGWTAFAKPFRDTALGPVRPLMWLLLGAVAFVLLITCANAASLLLARAANRTHELGVRAALGAGRGRLLRQIFTESLMLSTAAGIVGIGLAYFFLQALLKLSPGDIPRIQDATLDIHVMVFLVAVTMLTSILFGILPSLAATRLNLAGFLKSGGMRGVIGGRRRLRGGLVIAQIALVAVLLTGTGLLLRSYINVLSVPTGFSASTIAVNVQLSSAIYADKINPRYNSPQKRQTFFRELLGGIKPIHGIQAAGAIDYLPLSNSEGVTTLEIEGRSIEKNQLVEIRAITADYLSAMQIPLVKGRNFIDKDGPGHPLAAIVNEAFAKKYFNGSDAIGRRFRGSPRLPWTTIVGVTGDVRNMSLEAPAPAQIYTSLWQADSNEAPVNSAYVTVRSSLPQNTVVSEIRAAVRSLDTNLAIADIHTMGDLVTQATARRRFQTTLLTVFSGVALFLAVVGVYGLLAYSVKQRSTEIGIRMALGSSKILVMRLILREGLQLVAIGLLTGLAVALAFTRLLGGFLYAVPPLDPITFSLAPVLLFAAAFAACLIPGYRAATIDPMDALRHE